MKNTTYLCDRCGTELGDDGTALESRRFCTRERIIYEVRYFGDWKKRDTCEIPITYELCTKCRESLERWLNNENA